MSTPDPLIQAAVQAITILEAKPSLSEVDSRCLELCKDLAVSDAVQVAASIVSRIARRSSTTPELRDELQKAAKALDRIADKW